jgi:hypothetical protein
MAKKEPATAKPGDTIRVRLLIDCEYGLCGQAASVPADMVDGLAGVVDAHPDSVAYAESL